VYNYNKILKEIKNLANPIVVPQKGDLYVGQYISDLVPSGMHETYIKLKQKNITVYIPKQKSLEHMFEKNNIAIGDHIALYVHDIHDFTEWGGKMPRWVVKKLTKVGDMYE